MVLHKEEIKYSLRNLNKRKARSFLTILSIFIGITTIFVFISFGLGLYFYVQNIATESGVDKIIVQANGMAAPGADDTFRLTDNDIKAIDKTKGVKESTGFYFKAVKVAQKNSRTYVTAMGVNPTNENLRMLKELMTVDILEGREFKKNDRGKVILGYNYKLDNKILDNGYKIGDNIEINDKKYDIIGFWEAVGNPSDDSNVYLVEDDMKALFPEDELSYGMIVVRADNIDKMDETVSALEKSLRKERDQEEGKEDFFVQTFEELIQQFSAVLNIIIGFIILIALISVIVSAVNTTNTMVTSVLERTKEIGIMKAIGAKKSVIRNIFLFESALLGFIAGVIGITLGFIITYFGGKWLTALGWGFLTPLYTWWLFVGLLVFSVFVGTASGVIVAVQASRQNPVDALRSD